MKQANGLTYAKHAEFCKNTIAKQLFQLLHTKQTNLALSADVTTSAELLDLAHTLGPEICILKTHIDIINDFTPALTTELSRLAKLHHFFIFEDRKFADIGNTVKQQYEGGIYQISSWADIINAHSLPGPGIISGLANGLSNQRGLLLLAEMSSANNLLDASYTQKTLTMAEQFPDQVIGFIAQHRLSPDPKWLYLTPGIQLPDSNHLDTLGQQYTTPERAIFEYGTDIIIVGRGIVSAHDKLTTAKAYRAAGWDAYQRRSLTSTSIKY